MHEGKTDQFTQAADILRSRGYTFDPVGFRWLPPASEQSDNLAAMRRPGSVPDYPDLAANRKTQASEALGAPYIGGAAMQMPPLYHLREYISGALRRDPRTRMIGSGYGMGAADLSFEFDGDRYFLQLTRSTVSQAYQAFDGESAAEADARETESLAHRLETLEARFHQFLDMRNIDVHKVNAMNRQVATGLQQLTAMIAEVRELNANTNVRITGLEDEHSRTRQIVADVNTAHGNLSGRVNDLERKWENTERGLAQITKRLAIANIPALTEREYVAVSQPEPLRVAGEPNAETR